MLERVVVLPAPLRPSSATTSPSPDIKRDPEQNLAAAVGGLQLVDFEHDDQDFLRASAMSSQLRAIDLTL